MRVDPKILCQLLESVEQVPQPELDAMPSRNQDCAVAAYHLRLLVGEGYLNARTHIGEAPRGLSLTVSGQRLLDELRSAPAAIRVFREGAARVTTSLLIALLLAKLRASGMVLGL